MSNYSNYKRKLRWKSTVRKHGRDEAEDLLQQQFDMPAAQNPEDPYLQGRYGPWRSEWKGGRLMDIYHDESPTPMEAIQAGNYDWQNGRLTAPPTQESIDERLKDWADEYGREYVDNIFPYQ